MEIIKRSMSIILAVVFLIICLIVSSVRISSATKLVNSYKGLDDRLKNQLSLEQTSLKNEVSKVNEQATGLNQLRFDKDNKIAEQFMNTIFTWNSYASYNQIRNDVMKKYHLKDDSPFMKTFLVKVDNTKMNGQNYNKIDTLGLNMHFESMTNQVIGIVGTRYTYFSIVNVSSKSKSNAEAIGTCAFIYTIDGDGNMSDLWGATVSQ